MSRREVKTYRVFAALHEDTDKGWVWLLLDPKKGFFSRSTIKITRGSRSVYCEHRNFDENIVRRYDATDYTNCMYFQDKKTAANRGPVDMSKLYDVIVISSWYRSALGGFSTEGFGGVPQELEISRPRFSLWADLRAACQHPEPGVRVATRVGILGTWLGVAALLPALAEVQPIKQILEEHIPYATLKTLALVVVFGVVCLFAGRGIRRK